MRQVWNEETLYGLLLSESVWVHIPVLAQILVKARLPWQLTDVDFFRPERVLPQMLPRYAFDRILF